MQFPSLNRLNLACLAVGSTKQIHYYHQHTWPPQSSLFGCRFDRLRCSALKIRKIQSMLRAPVKSCTSYRGNFSPNNVQLFDFQQARAPMQNVSALFALATRRNQTNLLPKKQKCLSDGGRKMNTQNMSAILK